MNMFDRTYFEGKSRFEETQWSLIRAANTDDHTRRNIIINNLTATYWKPVYCYLLRKGYNNEEAKDLTQGFFCEIVLEKDLIRKADQAKGHFRSLLLTALERYTISIRRRETRQKALPKGGIIELDPGTLAELPVSDSQRTPEEAFYCEWAVEILKYVLSEVEYEYCSSQRSTHWQVFRICVLQPIISGTKSPPLKDVCARLKISEEPQISNMIVTVKRRFRTILKRKLRDFVHSDSAVNEELASVFEILSKCSAR